MDPLLDLISENWKKISRVKKGEGEKFHFKEFSSEVLESTKKNKLLLQVAEVFQLTLESHQNSDQNSQLYSTKVAKLFTPNDSYFSM